MMMAMPGTVTSHQAMLITSRPWEIMMPQEMES